MAATPNTPRDASAATPTIVIAIDGLRAAALGAYGQTACPTPALDDFAAEAETYEWAYAPTPEPLDTYARLAAAPGLPAPDLLLTDDAATTAPLADRAARVVEVTPSRPAALAESIGATEQAAFWVRCAEELVRLTEAGDEAPLAWLHSRGLYGPWDAPIELIEAQRDEDDPDFGTPTGPPDNFDADPGSSEACDARFAASCRYAAQVAVLDACLAGLLEVIDGLYEGREVRVLIVGLRGFPLGEHGRIGGVDPRLFSEQQHAPLLVRRNDPQRRFARDRRPTTIDSALAAELANSGANGGEARLSSASGAQALRTEDWLLRRPAPEADPDGLERSPELYVKPDDRWEQNDIASLETAACEELLALLLASLSAADSGVAAPGASN